MTTERTQLCRGSRRDPQQFCGFSFIKSFVHERESEVRPPRKADHRKRQSCGKQVRGFTSRSNFETQAKYGDNSRRKLPLDGADDSRGEQPAEDHSSRRQSSQHPGSGIQPEPADQSLTFGRFFQYPMFSGEHE